ncbi:MAG: cusR [Patescibacteria group bacterium]|nr:cusR [Patescibacteria group bacterium]
MRILIIEDDLDTATFVKSRLEEKCFAVDIETDGNLGLRAARTNDYDLILVDYNLPSRNGFSIISEIRSAEDKRRVHTPIIMISVIGEIPHKVEGFTMGADDYVTKPFFFDELFARIQAILRRPNVRKESVFKVDDLTLDTNRQKVIRGNESVYLTRKEFALLEYLLRNEGMVVSRGMITEHVWDMNVDPFSNTIEMHILNLRKKIDRTAKSKLIHSIPGRGYKIDIAK